MTFDELVHDISAHMILVNAGSGTVTTALSSTDDVKQSLSYVQSMTRGALASIAAVIAKSPLKGDIWAFCRKSKGLKVNAQGRYTMGQGNPSTTASMLDADEVDASGYTGGPPVVRFSTDDTASDTTDTRIDGHIVTVEVTYATPASAADADGNPNETPFPNATTTWYYAEPDSADAIYRRRLLASRLQTPLRSYELVGKDIYIAGTGLRITYVPSDFGTLTTDSIPNEYHFPIMCEALAMLYGQQGGNSGINAAQYYASRSAEYRQFIMQGGTEFAPLPPYMGT